MSHRIRNLGRGLPLALGIAALAVLWACDGKNVFAPGTGTGSGSGGPGGIPPTVEIKQPREPAARPIGDSVLITARAVDDVGLDSLLFLGVAFRGDRDLGTDTIVPRYVSKLVRFDSSVRDTTISRYLPATPDTTPVRRMDAGDLGPLRGRLRLSREPRV